MSRERYAELAARLLRQGRRTAGAELGDRAGAVAAIEQALRGRRRRLVVIRAAGAAIVAGAVVTIGLLLLEPEHVAHRPARPGALAHPGTATLALGGNATLLRRGTLIAAAAGAAVLPGDQIRAPGQGAAIVLPNGSRLRVAADGALDLLDLGAHARLALRAGRVHAEVAKLRPGERFVLSTADAEIEVKGTSFEVALVADPGCEGNPVTQVDVREGMVVVSSAERVVLLGAGERWRAGCAPAARAPRPVAAGRGRPLAARRAPAPEVAAPPAPPVEATAGSTLGQENDLFAAALLAEKTGDVAAALRHLDELLVRFPGGALAPAAREQRQRLGRAAVPPPPGEER